MVPQDATRFAVNLQRGADPEHADLHLHLCARLGDSPVVVRNSRSRGDWGVEELLPGSFPFPVGARPFLLIITAYLGCYEVEINGSSTYSLQVRDGLPISSITHMAIEAGLLIRAIHIPVESMPRNLRLSIGGSARVGDMFFLKGEPVPEAENFVINWQTGPGKFDDVLFHLNSKLKEGCIVRNSRTDDEWGKEDKIPESSINPEKSLLLVVGISSLGFETRLDGKDLGRYDHRCQDISSTTTLFMEGDLKPTDIAIHCAQVAPPTVNGTKIKPRGVRLQMFHPEVPVTSRVTGGFEKGCVLLLSGTTTTAAQESANKFELCVECGQGPESDVALRYEGRWPDGAVLNSREEGTWGDVVKAYEGGPSAGRHFELLIARLDDGFRVFLDGDPHADLPYRLEDTLPDTVTISGAVEIHRLLLL